MKYSGMAIGIVGVAGNDEAIARLRAAGLVVHEYETPDAIAAACRTQSLGAIVCGLGPGLERCSSLPLVPPPAVSLPLILRIDLSAGGAVRVMDRVDVAAGARLSIRSVSALDADVLETLEGDWPSADVLIARSLLRGLQQLRGDVAAGVAACGTRRCNAATLAHACGVAPRTLQWRLAHAGSPTARRLLAWAVTLHTLWRLEVLMWPLKRVAAHAGFRSPEALSNYVLRQVGERPTKLAVRSGFHEVLERCVRDCRGADARPIA